MTVEELYEELSLPVLVDENCKTGNDWLEKRRKEIFEICAREEYGFRPVERPEERFEVSEDLIGPGGIRRRDIRVIISGEAPLTIRGYLYLPARQAGKLPGFVALDMFVNPAFDAKPPFPGMPEFHPWQHVTDRGYAYIAVDVLDAAGDKYDGFTTGAFDVFDQGRDESSWGALSAWGWAASRILDYLETDPDVDASRLAIVGCSRLGKAAVWCGASDTRFAMVVSDSSGCGGAGISRATRAETIGAITKNFPHWFCGNYKRWAGHEFEAPFDQHSVLSLAAPRLLYVQSSEKDPFCDIINEHKAACAVTPVYRLFGYEGLGEDVTMPPVNKPVFGDRVGYHIREGGHGMNAMDWSWFMDFADTRL